MRHFWRNLFHDSAEPESLVPSINSRRAELSALSDADLRAIDWRAMELPDVIAITAVVAERVLGLKMFDVQVQGALALTVASCLTAVAAALVVVWWSNPYQPRLRHFRHARRWRLPYHRSGPGKALPKVHRVPPQPGRLRCL